MTHTRNAAASRKNALAPDTAELDDRAARAWTERMAVTPLGGGLYEVEGQSGAAYTVDLLGGRCTCPDHAFRDVTCKHLRRVSLEINQGRVPPPGKRFADCAACGAPTTVPEDEEPPLCPACRLEPGDPVVDRETGDRLVVSAVTDRRAAEVRIPEKGCTVAEYPTNRGYDPADPVVEATYPFGDRRYAFPVSRLERRDPADG